MAQTANQRTPHPQWKLKLLSVHYWPGQWTLWDQEFEVVSSSIISIRDMTCNDASNSKKCNEEDIEVNNFVGGDSANCSA